MHVFFYLFGVYKRTPENESCPKSACFFNQTSTFRLVAPYQKWIGNTLNFVVSRLPTHKKPQTHEHQNNSWKGNLKHI